MVWICDVPFNLLACLTLVSPQGKAVRDPAATEAWVLELRDRLRWPFEVRRDVVWCAAADDVTAKPPSLRLGARLWHVGADAMLPLRVGARVTLPVAGMRRRPGDTAWSVELGSGQHVFRLRLRLEGIDGGHLTGCGRRSGPSGLDPSSDALAAELTALYATGPGLRIVFENLDELAGGTEAVPSFLWSVLAPRFRELSAARTSDPGPGRRGRAGILARHRKPAAPAPRHFHSDELTGLPRLGLLEHRNGRYEAAGASTAGVHRRLLARFLGGLVWPLPRLPRGARRMQRPDDCWQRHGLEEHRGIDLGATVCLADGRLGGWPAGTPVTAPHVAARPWPIERDDARAWLVELEDEGVVLRVLLVGYHLAGGALASFDGSAGPGSWRSVDPVFRALGYPKGNHLHLEILGLHANTRRLRLFIEQRLMPALLRAPARPGSSKPVAFFRSRVPATHRPGVAVSRLLSGAARALPALPLERRGRRWRLTRPFVPGPAWHQSGARMAELRLVEGPGLQLALRLDGLGRGPTCVDFTWSNGIGLDVATCAALAEDFLIPALLARARK